MERVVDYNRVSTEAEEQVNALKSQREENAEFIKKNLDWVHVDSYVDEGKSATTVKGRGEFQRLLADMQKDKFDVVLIKIIDRGWRNSLDWKLFERMLIMNKKKLFIRTRNSFYDFTNPMDRMATSFEAEFAEWSSINQSIKMNDANQRRMSKGSSVITNGKIWGYKQVDGKLIPDPEQEIVVKRIFESYVSGKGFRTIKQELDNEGITNLKGKPFALTTLKRIIKQEKYKGTLICGKRHFNFFTKEYDKVPESEWHIHEDAVPALVSKELWEKANQMLEGKRKEFGIEDKRQIAGYFAGKYPLSGKIKCSKCNRPFYHSKYNTMKYALWECQGYREFGKKHEKGCDNIRIPEYEMDKIVRKVIFDFWKDKDESIKRVLAVLEKVLKTNDYQPTVDKITQEIERIKQKKRNRREWLDEGTINKEEFIEDMKEFDSRLNFLQNEINNLINNNKDVVSKRDRLLEIQNQFKGELDSVEGITDDMIENVVDKVVVCPENVIKITLLGDFTFDIQPPDPPTRGRKKKDNCENVLTARSHGYSHRSCVGQIQGPRQRGDRGYFVRDTRTRGTGKENPARKIQGHADLLKLAAPAVNVQ